MNAYGVGEHHTTQKTTVQAMTSIISGVHLTEAQHQLTLPHREQRHHLPRSGMSA